MYTYGLIKTQFLGGTQNTGSTDANLTTWFQNALDGRYQLMLANLTNYQTQKQKTATTVSTQQFYHNAAGLTQIETATVQVGSINFPMEVIHSQLIWDRINEVLISTSAIPQFMFPRRDDFGIWPIPQAAYTVTFNYNARDRKMTQDDYTTGTVSVTNNSQTVTSSGATFASWMADSWFQITGGLWYRISKVDTNANTLTLETSYEGATAATQTYTVGQAPEIPEEGGTTLLDGLLADYFSQVRSDPAKANYFNNMFWTGDGANADRTGRNVMGGLIGLKDRYAKRSDKRIIRRNIESGTSDKLWGTVLSTS